MSDGGSALGRGAFLLMFGPGAERARVADYVAALPRMHAVHGGRQLVLAPALSIEHFGHKGEAHSVILSVFPSMQGLREYWESSAHRRAAARCRGAEDLLAVALDAEPGAAQAQAESVAVFLGPGPSPALLEAEGAQALALVRERALECLHGEWPHGDVAIYAWESANRARRPLLSFSSGQRGRGLLLPALPGAQTEGRLVAA